MTHPPFAREGLTFTDNPHPLLSLDDLRTRSAIVDLMEHVRPIVRYATILVGSFVIEQGEPDRKLRKYTSDWYYGVGILVVHRKERYAYVDTDGFGIEEAWYIQYGQSFRDICRWTNASFMYVPLSSHSLNDAS
jgi:hypothetical protein